MNKIFFKNKKGDVPITLLVLGVVAICGLTILSFIVSGTNISESFVNSGLGIFEEIYSAEEKFYFYENINYDGFSDGEVEIGALLDTANVEVVIKGDVLNISGGAEKNIFVEYITSLD